MKPNRTLIIDLPCRDLPRAKAFYAALGFACEPNWTGEHSVCLVLAENLNIMLLSDEQFRKFSPKPPCDPRTQAGLLLVLMCDSREEVDDFVRKAVAAGGTTFEEAEDDGFMYSHSFQDPEGYGWGVNHIL